MTKKKQSVSNDLKLLELQLAVMQHCQSLKAVTHYLEGQQYEGAIARLEGAVAALHAVIRAQCVGVTMQCPACGSAQNVVAWVDDGQCAACGNPLQFLK